MDMMVVESRHTENVDDDDVDDDDVLLHHRSLAAANFHVGAGSSPELSRALRFPRPHRHNVDEESGPGPPRMAMCLDDDDDEIVLGNIYDDDGDEDLAHMMAIHRVDSKDVLFEQKRRKVKVLGKYVMGDKLGDGSYAKVKEAIDSETLCRRAIKIMKRKKLKKIPRGEENVEREIQLISKLDHPNIMRLIEVFYNDEKGKIYMVLEYCCAVLNDMLEQSPVKKFPTWQAHFYFCQLMDGLEYLQSSRIVHKDIKPGNLLLDTAGVLKIADFGVAEMLDLFAPDDMIKVSQGTPAFQPPEVANGVERFPGFKVDIWSCGVTLFNFVTGSYPFEGHTIFRLFENIGKGEFDVPRADVDTVLEGLIRGMLNKNFDERFNVKQVREHDWCRKRYPCNAPPVTVQPRNDDPNLSMSVIPYLQLLHFGDESGSAEAITEHDLREQERRQQLDDEATPALVETRRPKPKKDKTMKCIKVRKLSGCVLS
jgi:serine/threonine-protein kinase 11